MKLTIAAIGTAIVLASSASAMVIPGDHLPSQPGGQSQFSTHGDAVSLNVSNPSNSPAGVAADGNTVTVSVFASDDAAPETNTGAWAR